MFFFIIIGWAMSQPLPVSDFEWVDQSTISEQDIMKWDDNNPKGLILEVCIIIFFSVIKDHSFIRK